MKTSMIHTELTMIFNKAETEPAKSDRRYILSSGRDIGRDYQTLIKAVDGLPVRFPIATLPRNLSDIADLPANVEVAHFNQEKMTALIKGASFLWLYQRLRRTPCGL